MKELDDFSNQIRDEIMRKVMVGDVVTPAEEPNYATESFNIAFKKYKERNPDEFKKMHERFKKSIEDGSFEKFANYIMSSL